MTELELAMQAEVDRRLELLAKAVRAGVPFRAALEQLLVQFARDHALAQPRVLAFIRGGTAGISLGVAVRLPHGPPKRKTKAVVLAPVVDIAPYLRGRP